MLRISDILKYLDSQMVEYIFKGNSSDIVGGFSSLKNYKPGSFTWVKNEKSYEFARDDIFLAFVQDGLEIKANNIIYSSLSKLAFFNTIEHFYSNAPCKGTVGINTYISRNVKISSDVVIGSNCTLDGDIEIGGNTIIGNNVVIVNKVIVGSNCHIQSGSVIGHDGFSWMEDNNHVKTMVKHFGGVIIEDYVLIGPNCVIDRGTIDDTLIKCGAKIDALCFIAHNVIIGENTILITGSKLYGSSIVGRNGYIATGIIRNQCSIGENAVVGMGAVVTKSVNDNTTVVGNPARIIDRK